MSIYLVRHARAGDRGRWSGEDWLRPLSRAGHEQARELVTVLQDSHFDRVLSSRYVRCMETVVPLAGARGLPIEVEESLAEGGDTEAVLTLVRKHLLPGAVMCSHGDVIPSVLSHLATNGVDLGPDPRCPKGCTWVLDGVGSEVTRATYIAPPNPPGD
jgi:8-oxo-dGTP diphosphatase